MSHPQEGEDAAGPWWKRLGWFVILWLGGVAAVSLVGLVIRGVLIG
ncbi:MAG TPA: DUF2474 domain-containing protein [Aurantimonas sp.]|uniref:DUF2474 domain-containing protein n=1 Tax=Aurantimonas marianensis TaxID=2920428 RepID=A0A9X2HCE4_9HYPH|nr:DUF2474 domain-containing protein [Aurantimonas marianensis]MCP3054374.1 DUF2474 domain-containing protein [Aurantimonas marianensis]